MDSLEQKPGVGVGIMVLRNNQILLGLRHGDPKKAKSKLHGEGTWTMPGGKLHWREKLKNAATREVFEETGVKTNSEKLKIIAINDDIVKDAHFVTIGFLCRNFAGKPKVMEPEQIIKWQWFDLDKLPSPLYLPSEKILKSYLKGFSICHF